MFRKTAILVGIVLAGWPGTGAWALELTARLYDHQNRVRLVLENPGGAIPQHQIKVIDDQTLEVAFDQPGQIARLIIPPSIPELSDVRVVSKDGEKLRLWVLQTGKFYARDMMVGNRVLIDFAQNPAARAGGAASTAARLSPTTAPKATPVVPVPTEAAVASPKPSVQAASMPVVDPTRPPVISLSAVEKFGLAAFITDDDLWVVIDQPDFVGAPTVEAHGVTGLALKDRKNTKEATIFHFQTPERGMAWRAEGGDLMWRLVAAAPDGTVLASEPERVESKDKRMLEWPLKGLSKIVSFDDPGTGETFRVVTVARADSFAGPARNFAEFTMPRTLAGLVMVPLVDDVTITTTRDGVAIDRPGGLSITSSFEAARYEQNIAPPPTAAQTQAMVATDIKAAAAEPEIEVASNNGRAPLFRLKRWAMGGPMSLANNEAALVADLIQKKPDERASGLMNISKMYLANGRGSEALGYARLAAEAQPGLAETIEFLGVRGAAYAMNGQFDLAWADLRTSGLDVYPDMDMWRSYVLAHLQDWAQAAERLKAGDLSWAQGYPPVISEAMQLTLAEVALRAGRVKEANGLLARIPDLDTATVIEPDQDRPRDRIVAYRDYLTAEAARQTGDKDRARRLWEELAKGRDQKYQARARLSLAVLDYEDGKIKPEQTIDQLEGLRYAWRGDELEMAVGARLGEIYLARGDYLRGLQVMRDAATLSPETDMGKRITATMTEAFRTLFTPAKMASVDPLDAITVFEKFTELAPSGDDANRLTLNLVDRLMQVDLLDRATKVMQDLVDYKLQDSQRVEVALRLAAVHLMNGRPDLSLAVLNRAEGMIAALPDLERAATLKAEQDMLRARALFQSDRTDQALAVLANMPEQAGALRVAADIAWQSGRWNDAARALEALMAMDPVAANKPPTPEQAELIRNLAVATNLSGDRARLAQLRAQYNLLMMQSDLATEFDIVTRERQTPTLADRDTLNKLVSEVDMFGSFLKTYRGQGGDAPAAGVNPASAPPSASPTNTPPPAQAEAEEAAPDVAAAPPAQAAAE